MLDLALYAAFAVLALVCLPSARWQKLLLTLLGLSLRLLTLAAFAGLGFVAVEPKVAPSAVVELLDAVKNSMNVGTPVVCLGLAILVALIAVPSLVVLDFTRSLADYRALSRSLLDTLRIVESLASSPTPLDRAAPPPAPRNATLPSKTARSGATPPARRCLGDLVS
jgi:hypothetical protein